jgi:hypothetical protein
LRLYSSCQVSGVNDPSNSTFCILGAPYHTLHIEIQYDTRRREKNNSVTYELFLRPAVLRKHFSVHDPRYYQNEVGVRNNRDIAQKEIFEMMLHNNLIYTIMRKLPRTMYDLHDHRVTGRVSMIACFARCDVHLPA